MAAVTLENMRIRQFDSSDRSAVIELWHLTGLVRPWNDPERDLERKLADSPWGMLVGVERPDGTPVAGSGAAAEPGSEPGERPGPGEQVVAAAMVGYDGHRGSVYYLAVHPEWRGHGFGSAVMEHAEALLLERGCPKMNVSVRTDNSQVIGFYADRGYRVEGPDVALTLGLRLIEDGPRT